MMRRIWSIQVVVIFLIVFFAIQPALVSTVQWICEGRVCGTQDCCCEQVETLGQDANCRPKTSPKGTVICQAECACTPVVTASDNPSTTLTRVASFAPLVYVPWTSMSLSEPAILIAYLPALLLDTRGPPVRTVALLPSGLRAPPLS
jgi:hypothetical protein